MSSSEREHDGDAFGSGGDRPPHGGAGRSGVWGWASKYVWRLSVAIMLLITAADALLGPRVILIGLLMVGPCCALFSARRVSTAQAGVIAVGLALLLALPDGIWGTVGTVRLHRRRLDGCHRLHLGRRDHRIDGPALSRPRDVVENWGEEIEAR